MLQRSAYAVVCVWRRATKGLQHPETTFVSKMQESKGRLRSGTGVYEGGTAKAIVCCFWRVSIVLWCRGSQLRCALMQTTSRIRIKHETSSLHFGTRIALNS